MLLHCSINPPSPISPNVSWPPPPRRRRCGRCHRGARRLALGRSPRRRGRGIAAFRRRRSRACASSSAASRPSCRPMMSGALASTRLAERAVAMARVAPEDRFAGLADRGAAGARFSRSRPARSGHADCRACSRSARAKPKPRGWRSRASPNRAAPRLRPALAAWCWSRATAFAARTLASRHGVSMTAIAGEGTGMETRLRFLLGAACRRSRERADTIGRSAGERAVKRLNPRKVTTRRVPVVFDPRVAGLAGRPSRQRRQRRAIARKTQLSAEKARRSRFSRPASDIIDDPLRRRGLRSRPFDAEASPAACSTLVEDGVLKTWLLDSATARELGLQTTGHAQRGVSSTPSPGPTNLHLRAGAQTPAAS